MVNLHPPSAGQPVPNIIGYLLLVKKAAVYPYSCFKQQILAWGRSSVSGLLQYSFGNITFFLITDPLIKTIILWPQFTLGLAFNWGAWLECSFVKSFCGLSLCLSLFPWSHVDTHDTICAHEDKQLSLSDVYTTSGQSEHQAVVHRLLDSHVGSLEPGESNHPYCVAFAGTATQIYILDIHIPEDQGDKFISNTQ